MKKEFKKAIFGGGVVSLISCFSTDKTLGTGHDIHLLCAMIADHVTLPAMSLLRFWAAGCSYCKKDCLIFFQFLAICWCLSSSLMAEKG